MNSERISILLREKELLKKNRDAMQKKNASEDKQIKPKKEVVEPQVIPEPSKTEEVVEPQVIPEPEKVEPPKEIKQTEDSQDEEIFL